MTDPAPTLDAEADKAAAAAAAATRADARARRIAAAVERSKREYLPEHAYTERCWFLSAPVAGPSKADRQHLEYAATARVPSDPRRALDDILACAGSKPLSSLPRELVATGARAAIAAGDKARAAEFARAARNQWRVPGAGVVASEALEFAGRREEATHPLFAATAEGIHYPVILRLARLLEGMDGDAAALRGVLVPLAESRAWAFARPLFGPGSEEKVRPGGAPIGVERLRSVLAGIDRGALRKALGVDGGVLDAAFNRLHRALGAEEEPEGVPGERVERGVREL